MSACFGLGVVIGKFLPPHKGHRFLIETAIQQCSHVVVIICGKPSDPIPGELRLEWLSEMIPTAEVRLIDDRYDENDSRVWAENTISWLGRAPDVVFTSENYGEIYAGHMKCQHVMVDLERATIPCSGTSVRKSPLEMWDYIDPPVRGWYAKRIVIVGAESTGTTTLAQDLAHALDTPWVPEYGREYSLIKQAKGESLWNSNEFLDIAHEQTRQENEAARMANRFLVCDTNAFATMLWHRRYLGHRHALLDKYGLHSKADLYLLTGCEIPFVQDGLRDGEHIRHEMHEWFAQALSEQTTPWFLVQGSRSERLAQALMLVKNLP